MNHGPGGGSKYVWRLTVGPSMRAGEGAKCVKTAAAAGATLVAACLTHETPGVLGGAAGFSFAMEDLQ